MAWEGGNLFIKGRKGGPKPRMHINKIRCQARKAPKHVKVPKLKFHLLPAKSTSGYKNEIYFCVIPSSSNCSGMFNTNINCAQKAFKFINENLNSYLNQIAVCSVYICPFYTTAIIWLYNYITTLEAKSRKVVTSFNNHMTVTDRTPSFLISFFKKWLCSRLEFKENSYIHIM